MASLVGRDGAAVGCAVVPGHPATCAMVVLHLDHLGGSVLQKLTFALVRPLQAREATADVLAQFLHGSRSLVLVRGAGSVDPPLAVATSKPEASAFPILDHFNLSRYFTVRAGATLDDSRSAKADVIQYAFNQFEARGQQPDDGGWMIGDRHHDVGGAIRHNLQSIGVTWGYGTREELFEAGAVAIADQPQDLLAILHNAEGPENSVG